VSSLSAEYLNNKINQIYLANIYYINYTLLFGNLEYSLCLENVPKNKVLIGIKGLLFNNFVFLSIYIKILIKIN